MPVTVILGGHTTIKGEHTTVKSETTTIKGEGTTIQGEGTTLLSRVKEIELSWGYPPRPPLARFARTPSGRR